MLAKIFEKSRNKCLEIYGLCFSNYLRVPALIWDAMCSMNKVKLDLILDFVMYFFWEKVQEMVFLTFLKRYSKANDKCSASYYHKKPTKYIIDLNKHNLYGYAMLKSPSMGRFK